MILEVVQPDGSVHREVHLTSAEIERLGLPVVRVDAAARDGVVTQFELGHPAP